MTGVQITLTSILTVCVALSGLFSGSETAFVALPRERIQQLSERGPRGRRLALLVDDTERTLGTLLVANNFVNILAASISTLLVVDFLTVLTDASTGAAAGPWVATLALTALILVVGEITPKTLAARHPESCGLMVAPAIWVL
jgi:Mg2+/Co2+ transporter CorB